MTATRNAGSWPQGHYATRHQMPDGRIVQVDINWTEIYWQARRAVGAKSQRSVSGPVTVKVVKS